MNSSALIALLQNTALLLAMVTVVDVATSGRRLEGRPLREVGVGGVLGVLAIGVILSSFRLETGIVFDTRSVLLGVSGLFLGVIPTAVAMLMAVAFRLAQGGVAAFAGAAVILTSGGLGIAWRWWRRSRRRDPAGYSAVELYAFGVVVHVAMLAWMLTLPSETAWQVVATVGPPVLLIYPPATMVLGLLLANRLQRQRAVAALAESEARYRTLFESNPHCMWIYDLETLRFLAVNDMAVVRYGFTREEFLGMTLKDIRPAEDVPRLMDNLERENAVVQQSGGWRHRDRQGRTLWVEVASHALEWEGRPARLVQVNDITERRLLELERQAMEVQLRQQQRLESIGTLASGVAHEINNPITGIMNYAQLIQDRLPEGSPLGEYTGEILHETQRVATIVRNLLTFSRKEMENHRPARVSDIIEGTLSLIRTVMRRDGIVLTVEVAPDLPLLRCRSQQIQQVLMNMMTNARDALNQRHPGSDPAKAMRVQAGLVERRGRSWIRLTVEDLGTGIEPEVRERIFDPFFTTKPRERGTGLGLAISHGIVKEHHGEITVETEPGRFTRLHVDLPVDSGGES